MDPEHTRWMEQALCLAAQAELSGEVPVAALAVHEGRVIGAGFNRNIADHDPSAHAEIVALRAAGKMLGNHRLIGVQLYCTLEPCLMCAGAIVHARIATLVYAAKDPKTGAHCSAFNVLDSPLHNHRVEVVGSVLADEASAMLSNFFRQRRLQSRSVG